MSRQTNAKRLRQHMTDAESMLWLHLRAHRLAGYKFKRQHVIGSYIVDFVSLKYHVIIELDGSQHLENAADVARDAWLQTQGFTVLRFWNDEVLKETDAVLEKILCYMIAPSPPPLSPLGRGKKTEPLAPMAKQEKMEPLARLRERGRGEGA